MGGIAPGKLLGIMQEGWSRRQIPETYPDGVPEIAAANGYPDDDDLPQAIIFPRRPSRDRSIRMIWDDGSGNGRKRTASEWAA